MGIEPWDDEDDEDVIGISLPIDEIAADNRSSWMAQLVAPDPQARREALERVREMALPGGVVTPATAGAALALVNLLRESLDDPQSHLDRADVLDLLSDLARGAIPNPTDDPNVLNPDLLDLPPDEHVEEQLGWVESSRDAVVSGVPLYLRCLAGPDERGRIQAAWVLAHCVEAWKQISPALDARLAEEGSPSAAAAYLLATGLGPRRDPEATNRLVRWLAPDRPPLARAGAALGLAWRLGPKTPLEAIPVLVGLVDEPGPLVAMYERLPFASGDLRGEAARALATCGPELAGLAAPLLLAHLDRVPPMTSIDLLASALHLIGSEQNWWVIPWNPNQRAAIAALVDARAPWDAEEALQMVLEQYGLPTDPDTLRSWLTSEGPQR